MSLRFQSKAGLEGILKWLKKEIRTLMSITIKVCEIGCRNIPKQDWKTSLFLFNIRQHLNETLCEVGMAQI